MELADRRCEACAPGTPPIDAADAERLMSGLDGSWERVGKERLMRTFEFRNFRDAFGMATKIALLAEGEGHHPDLEVGWGRLVVSLTTHAAKGLTENDFIMAAKVDRIAAAGPSKG